jgi:hypothetical protein
MTLVTRGDFTGTAGNKVGKENMAHTLKKYVWQDDAGKVAETTNRDLPKGWVKGKLLGAKGQEVSDVLTKEWGLGTKAKAPAENKGK